MKKTLYAFVLLLSIASCKNDSSEKQDDKKTDIEELIEDTISKYPENFSQVLDAHGGIDAWNDMGTLEFSVERPGGYEITTTDLENGYTLVEMPEHTLGFDGDSIWEITKGKTKFKENPKNYYNKVFKVYAVPFIFADEATRYTNSDSLHFNGVAYPGIKVQTDENSLTGEHTFMLYYDKDTSKVAWLAFPNASDADGNGSSWQFINYPNWQEVEGLLLPETMIYYTSENRKPVAVEKEVHIISPMLTTVKMDLRVYSKPEPASSIQ